MAHPYTLASADQGDCRVRFEIKALGDYTRNLAKHLSIGQRITVEGPYGRFDYARHNPKAKQIWIAGGIGVTPFLAWLEALQSKPGQMPAVDLHYCTRDRTQDPYVARLATLCQNLPGIRLQVHGSRQGEVLKPAALVAGVEARVGGCTAKRPAQLWAESHHISSGSVCAALNLESAGACFSRAVLPRQACRRSQSEKFGTSSTCSASTRV